MQKKAAKDLVAISFCVDHSDSEEEVSDELKTSALDALTERKMTIINAVSKTGVEDVLEYYGSVSVPCVMIFGRDGKRVKLFDEEFTYGGDVEPFVDELLK